MIRRVGEMLRFKTEAALLTIYHISFSLMASARKLPE